MPMGIVTDEDFQKEREKIVPKERPSIPTSVPTATIIDSPTKGRGEGNVEVPNSLRQIIGETSITDGRQEAVQLASHFGISPSSVSAYSRGATSTSTYDERPNEKVINGTKLKIERRARAKLMLALKSLTPEVMASAKARDLAGIAKDMAAVVKQMEPETPKGPGNNTGPTYIFYSPQQRKEESYEMIFTRE